jgi:hypothetical protein
MPLRTSGWSTHAIRLAPLLGLSLSPGTPGDPPYQLAESTGNAFPLFARPPHLKTFLKFSDGAAGSVQLFFTFLFLVFGCKELILSFGKSSAQFSKKKMKVAAFHPCEHRDFPAAEIFPGRLLALTRVILTHIKNFVKSL